MQVGDPFTEKLLLEASLELIERRIIVAIQDMGAAGLTSSSAEMAARGGVGVDLDTARVPTRVPGMTPYEILLSESQERMLVVAEPDRVADVQATCQKWELTATPIGSVTGDGIYRVRHGDVVVAAIPGDRLISDCPVYQPDAREDPAVAVRRATRPASAPRVGVERALEVLLDCPTIASKQWVYEQYDSTVRANTRLAPGGDAGVVMVEGTAFGLALSVDCNARLVALDPYEGAKAAVAEAARNIACTGAIPLGVTDCLNFGSPERPEVFFQFQEACRGIGDACRAFDTPVTGGNVSFYNESPAGAIDPTPTIGMVGLLERVRDAVGSHFRSPGDRIIVLGETTGDMGGSAYWAEVHRFTGGRPALVDLDAERALQQLLTALARDMLASSAHDCSDGGLAVTLAESAMAGPYAPPGFGATIDLTPLANGMSIEQILYGENGARAVVSCHAANEANVLRVASDHGVLATPVGSVEDPGGRLVIRVKGATVSWEVERLRTLYFSALPRRMGPAGRDTRRDA